MKKYIAITNKGSSLIVDCMPKDTNKYSYIFEIALQTRIDTNDTKCEIKLSMDIRKIK